MKTNHLTDHYQITVRFTSDTPTLCLILVKKRYKAQTLTYMGSGSTDSAYGTLWFHRFVTAEGNIAVWSTGTSLSQIAQGKALVMDYSVKEHSEYKGVKQTYITRCKIAGLEVSAE